MQRHFVYKKYLSINLPDLISHNISNTLEQLLQNQRVPHATILFGKMGFGTLAAGLDLAKGLLCTNIQSGKACNNCSSCIKVSKSIHPDLHFAFPVVKKSDKKRAETTSKDFLPEWRELLQENQHFGEKEWAHAIEAAGKPLNINTAECNEIIKKLSLKAFDGTNKVLIIYLAEYLAKEGNRLLKLIEEPTPNSYIILLAENSGKILNTILSRCQAIQVHPFSDSTIIDYLVNQKHMDQATAAEIAFLSNGDLQVAKNMVFSSDHSMSEQLIAWFRYCFMSDQNPKELIEWIDNYVTLDKSLQISFIEYVLHFLRELNRWILTQNDAVRLTNTEKEVAKKMQKIIDMSKVEKLSQIMDNLYYHLERNANAKLELLATSMEIGQLLKQKILV